MKLTIDMKKLSAILLLLMATHANADEYHREVQRAKDQEFCHIRANLSGEAYNAKSDNFPLSKLLSEFKKDDKGMIALITMGYVAPSYKDAYVNPLVMCLDRANKIDTGLLK
jgi:hypothetical protein